MPAELERCVQHVMDKGHSESSAYAICRTSMGLAEDGSQDGGSISMTDEEIQAVVNRQMRLQAEFRNGPEITKDFVLARVGKNYRNGAKPFDLTDSEMQEMVKNFKSFRKLVPVYLLPDHPPIGPERSAIPADGWVADLWMDGDRLMTRLKLHGPAAVGVLNEDFLGTSLGAFVGKDLQGKPVGQILDHVLITNTPFFSDLNSIAARIADGCAQAVYLTSRQAGGHMADPKTDPDPKAGKPTADPDEQAKVLLKQKDEELIKLKGENLELKESVEDLQARLANAKVDEDKEKLAIENVRFRKELFAMKLRALVTHGLQSGTLRAAWCDGYAGKGPVDYDGTVRWLKASKFYDNTIANSEDEAFRVLKWAVENNPPMYKVGASFASGMPAERKGLTLTQEDKKDITDLGHKPDEVVAAREATSYSDYVKRVAAGKEN